MQEIIRSIDEFVGKDIREVVIWQITVRAIFTYLFTILIVRLGDKRFMGQSTAFDAVLGFILGSVASRAVNGNAPFVESLLAAAVLVLLHWGFSALIYFGGDQVGGILKGRSVALVRDGEIDERQMRKHRISKKDLEGAMRQWANIGSLEEVKLATLERSGVISCVVRKDVMLEKSFTNSSA